MAMARIQDLRCVARRLARQSLRPLYAARHGSVSRLYAMRIKQSMLGDLEMGDVIAVAYGILVFAALIGYVIACEAI